MNRAGRALIQSAAPGVSTHMLEGELDNLDAKWETLNAKVSSYLHHMPRLSYITFYNQISLRYLLCLNV